MRLIELHDDDGLGEDDSRSCESEGFVETEDDEIVFPVLSNYFAEDDTERPLSELIKAASTVGPQAQQSQTWEVSSMAMNSNMAMMTMIQRKKFVRPWEGQGVKVIGGGKLVDYLDGEAIPEIVDENQEVYNWW